MAFLRTAPDGALVRVKVRPRSRRPGILGRAPAPDGERLFRDKTLRVTGDPERLVRKLEAL